MTSVNYLPWKTVGQHRGVSYFDLLNDLGIGVMEAEGVKGQLRVLEQDRKVELICTDPPHNNRIIVIRPKNETAKKMNSKGDKMSGSKRFR